MLEGREGGGQVPGQEPQAAAITELGTGVSGPRVISCGAAYFLCVLE